MRNNCSELVPTAKRARPATDSADTIFDMSPWAAEFAEWRAAQQALQDSQVSLEDENVCGNEDVNTLEETKGCAILDSGATVMCSYTAAAEEIHFAVSTPE